MLRFILRHKSYDGIDFKSETLSTLDADCPLLEKALLSGGYGAGPNGDAYDHTALVGVEVLAEAKAAGTQEEKS